MFDRDGETIDGLEWVEDQHGLEATVKDWLRKTITRLEEERGKQLLTSIS
jgi:hypothetical protein